MVKRKVSPLLFSFVVEWKKIKLMGGKIVYGMISFANDINTCRKVLFSRYFKSVKSKNSFEENDNEESICNHCDNVSSFLVIIIISDLTLY